MKRKLKRKAKQTDSLFEDMIKNPAHVDPEKLKQIDLEQLEDELWLGGKLTEKEMKMILRRKERERKSQL